MSKEHVFAKELSSRQRSRLRGLAHSLKPVVQLGNQGLSEGLISAVRAAAGTHELIKVQLNGATASDKSAQESELESLLGPRYHLAGRTGRMLVLYFEKEPSSAKLTLASLKNQ